MGSSMTSMPEPEPVPEPVTQAVTQAARASSASPGAAIMRTGSKAAMARATAAYSCLAASKAGPQRAGRVGQAIRQASRSAHAPIHGRAPSMRSGQVSTPCRH